MSVQSAAMDINLDGQSEERRRQGYIEAIHRTIKTFYVCVHFSIVKREGEQRTLIRNPIKCNPEVIYCLVEND